MNTIKPSYCNDLEKEIHVEFQKFLNKYDLDITDEVTKGDYWFHNSNGTVLIPMLTFCKEIEIPENN